MSQNQIDYNMRIMSLDKNKLISEARRLVHITKYMINHYKNNNPDVEIKYSTDHLACPQYMNENQLNTIKSELNYFYCNLPQTFGQMINCPIDDIQLQTFIDMINDVIGIGNREINPELVKKKYSVLFDINYIHNDTIANN